MAMTLGRPGERRAAWPDDEGLDHLPPHLRDDMGLPPADRPEPEPPSVARARRRASRWGV